MSVLRGLRHHQSALWQLNVVHINSGASLKICPFGLRGRLGRHGRGGVHARVARRLEDL